MAAANVESSSGSKSSQLTDKQQAILKQFKSKIADVLRPSWDDDFLLRWLRARNWDLQKSEKMYRDSLEWRRTYEADRMLEWNPPEVLQKYCRGGVFGCDKEGYPVYMELLGKVDFKGVFQSASKKDILRFRTLLIEEIIVKLFPVCSAKAGRKIDQISILVDMDGVGYKHLWKPLIDTVLEWLPMIELNYPEILRNFYIVNAPSVFPVLYNLAKPFIQEYTRQKIRILGSNWKQAILKDIDADQLPSHFGGSRDVPLNGEPFTSLPVGGPIPQSYYLKSSLENIDLSQYTTVTVNAGGSVDVEVDVEKPDSVLSWNFWTNAKDVAFGVYQSVTNGSKYREEELVPNSRVNCHMVPESGNLKCEKPGKYIVRFDNSYSWMSSKKLSYLVEVLQPDTSSEELNVKDMQTSDF